MDAHANYGEASDPTDWALAERRGAGGVPARTSGFDYVEILYREKWLVLAIVLIFVGGAYLFARLSPTRYEATLVLSPAAPTVQTGGIAAGALAGLGLGADFGRSSQKYVALALLESRALMQRFIVDNNLLPVLFAARWNAAAGSWAEGVRPPTLEDGYKRLHGTMRIEDDRIHDIVKVQLRWTSSQMAADWANGLVKMVNADMQAHAIAAADSMISYLNGEYNRTTIQELRTNVTRLIEEQIKARMMASSQNDFALTVIDPAEPTRVPVEPRPRLLMVGGGILGLLLGVLAAFSHYGWNHRRVDAARRIEGRASGRV